MLDHFYTELRQMCVSSSRILLTGPVSPDADSLASCLALRRMIMFIGGKEPVVIGNVPFQYRNLCDINHVQQPDEVQAEDFSLAIVLDGDQWRLDKIATHFFQNAEKKAIIDHHGSTQNDGYELFWVEPTASSTTEMLYQLMQAWKVPLDAKLAELIYAGLVYDTGGFCYENTRSKTLRLASTLLETGFAHTELCMNILQERRQSGVRLLGYVLSSASYICDNRVAISSIGYDAFRSLQCTREDIDGIVEMLLATVGVQVAVLCLEFEVHHHKISFRSRSGSNVDVALLAQRIISTGGGHKRAAGLRIQGAWKDISQKLYDELGNIYG